MRVPLAMTADVYPPAATVSDQTSVSAGTSSGADGLVEAGTWRIRSAVCPCCARACALAPAVVAVLDVTSMLKSLPRFAALSDDDGFLSSDSFRDFLAPVVSLV